MFKIAINNGFDATDAIKNLHQIVVLKEKNPMLHCPKKCNKLVCLGYNHVLFKSEKYNDEEEWRIIIPKNRYSAYFGAKDLYTKDFSSLMQSICLGSEFNRADVTGEMYDYALQICQKYKIPLYIMRKNGEKLEKKIQYSPE